MARNKAFFDFFSSKIIVVNLFAPSIFLRLMKTFQVCLKWIFIKNHKVLLHQGTFFLMFPDKLQKFRVIQVFSFYLLRRLARRNKVFLEINDLRYEQAISLELNDDLDLLLVLQMQLFKIEGLQYIFASDGLKKYAIEHYHVNEEFCQTVINGGAPLVDSRIEHLFPDLGVKLGNGNFNFVYAGSLNKGRQIESILDIFKSRDNCNLILLGQGGEWIVNEFNNIFYLGNFEEHIAHQIVAKCDIGIIPYDSTRLYYNICYPTKVSFYIAAGIGILSTPLDTLKRMFEHDGFINFCELDNWPEFLNDLNKVNISEVKSKAVAFQNNIYWDNILKKIKF